MKKKGKKWVHRKAENFLRKRKNGDAQKRKKIATIDGPHYSPMKKKGHIKKTVSRTYGAKKKLLRNIHRYGRT